MGLVERGLHLLDKYCPQWDDYDFAIHNIEVCNRKVISMPPTYDLMKKFLGPKDKNADGWCHEKGEQEKVRSKL